MATAVPMGGRKGEGSRVEGFMLSGYCCAHGREEGRGEQGGGVYAEWLLLCLWEGGRERGAGWRGLGGRKGEWSRVEGFGRKEGRGEQGGWELCYL